MCDVYHVVGIVTTLWSDSGIRVLAGISAAGRLCEVSICVLLSLDCIFIQRLPIFYM